MKHVRPKQIFSMQEDPDAPFRFFLPSSTAGGLTTIESVVMVSLLKLIRPRKVFEFGTFKGYTTRLLLENLDDQEAAGERVFTLDLPSTKEIHFQSDDRELAEESVHSQRKFALSDRCHLVRQLLQDSMSLDCTAYSGGFQYIFIDGNHHLSYASRDTENAFKMLDKSNGCIIWHDYGNKRFPELTHYLETLSDSLPLVHIGDTMLVVYMPGHEIPGA